MFRGQLFSPRLFAGRLWGQNGQDSVIPGIPPNILTTSPLATGTVGVAYAQSLAASGTVPITWALVSGALPAGLGLNVTTGLIEGTPLTSVVSSFTISATNSAGTVTAPFQMLVSSPEPDIPPGTGTGAPSTGVIVGGGFKVALLQGVHNFSTGGDTFKIALYDTTAEFPTAPPAYTTTDEVVGAGYPAGGIVLTNVSPTLVDGVAVATFNNAVFPSVTLTARYALIYNASKANATVAVINFGQSYSVYGGNFEIAMPPATATNAFIRVT